ncbi:hypothetical protein HPB47_020084 [Ixodes persulcatus]|uniref:Uncharacterized protein n=1 Tax=Ixodes persulcatus TaxID=34615 RepID=A0AC60QGC6_IXOPE|nr:hypothetical protein HPB47_020084 [Ixodes persulcatus]
MLEEPVTVVEKLLEVIRQHMTRSVTGPSKKKASQRFGSSVASTRVSCSDRLRLRRRRCSSSAITIFLRAEYVQAIPRRNPDVHKETISALGRNGARSSQQTSLYWKRRDGTSQEEGKARARGKLAFVSTPLA